MEQRNRAVLRLVESEWQDLQGHAEETTRDLGQLRREDNLAFQGDQESESFQNENLVHSNIYRGRCPENISLGRESARLSVHFQ